MASNVATWGSVRKRRSKSAGEGTGIVVLTPDDPFVPFFLKDFDQECPSPRPPSCAEFWKSEHRSLKPHNHLLHQACYLSKSIKGINTEHVYWPYVKKKTKSERLILLVCFTTPSTQPFVCNDSPWNHPSMSIQEKMLIFGLKVYLPRQPQIALSCFFCT